jgi:hypothetical protein
LPGEDDAKLDRATNQDQKQRHDEGELNERLSARGLSIKTATQPARADRASPEEPRDAHHPSDV